MGKPLMEQLLKIKIKKIHISRSLAAAITLLAMLGVFLVLYLIIAPLLGSFFINIANLDYADVITRISEPFKSINDFIIEIFPSIGADFKLENFIFEEIQKIFITSSIASFFASIASLLINTVLGVLIVLFISFFFLKENIILGNRYLEFMGT